MRSSTNVFVAFAAPLFFATTAFAQEGGAHEQFVEHVFLGCVPAVTNGSLAPYVEYAKLVPASREIEAAFLRGRPGTAFVKPDPKNAMVVVETADKSCTVAARLMPDADGLVPRVEKMLIGPGAPFKAQDTKTSTTLSGETATTRTYAGSLDGVNYYVLLSTSSGTNILAQAMLTIARVK